MPQLDWSPTYKEVKGQFMVKQMDSLFWHWFKILWKKIMKEPICPTIFELCLPAQKHSSNFKLWNLGILINNNSQFVTNLCIGTICFPRAFSTQRLWVRYRRQTLLYQKSRMSRKKLTPFKRGRLRGPTFAWTWPSRIYGKLATTRARHLGLKRKIKNFYF